MLLNKNDKQEDKIKKSKEIIKKEKEKIRQAKKERKSNKKINKIFKKLFFIKDSQEVTKKNQLFIIVYSIIIGFLLCLLCLYVLSGGRNYFKLYYELNKLIDTYDTITSNYYGDLSKEQLIDNAIDSMISSIGDEYTTYSDTDSANTFSENIEGTYEGIGCTVTMNEENNIIVASVFEDSPSEKAGLKEDDIIIKIDDEDYTNKTSNDVAQYVKESTKEQIKLTIIRDNQEQELTIERSKIEVPTVTSKTYEQNGKKIGYIKLSIFSTVATNQFKSALTKLENEEKIEGLVIDVRDNTGGYLTTVTDIASLFLEKNEIIYQLQSETSLTKKKDTTKEKRTYPIAVLINQNSASASEILASAIKESYGGEVVGVNSYGKGTVQKTKKLADGSMIKYTVQKWLTPDGNWINNKGVTPTKIVELDQTNDEDNQLQTAIELVENNLSK